MRPKKILILLATASLVSFSAASCLRDREFGGPGGGTGEDATVNLSVSVPGVAPTRSLSPDDETNVETVDVILFKKTGSEWYYYYTVQGEMGSGSGSTKNFTARLPLGTYDLSIVANGREIVYNAFLKASDTKTEALNRLIQEQAVGVKWTSGRIPMWGEVKDVTVTEGMNLSVRMARMLARIDVKLSRKAATGSTAPSASGNDNFSLEKVYLYNYSTRGVAVPDLVGGWNPGSDSRNPYATAPNRPAEGYRKALYGNGTGAAPLEYTAADQHSGAQFIPDSLIRAIYTFEAPAGNLRDYAENTCLVVGGTYKGSTETYYRVDFATMNAATGEYAYMPLKRNHNYVVTITHVEGPGCGTPHEAFNSAPVNITAEVTEWSSGGSSQNVLIDGKNRLTLTRDVILTGNEGSARGMAISNVINTTDTGSHLRIAGPFEPDSWNETGGVISGTASEWLRDGLNGAAVSVSGTDTDDTRTITVTDIPEYTGAPSADREAHFVIRSGNMRYIYKVVQSKDPWLAADDDVFLLDGTVQHLDVTALTDWTVCIKDVGYNNIVNGKNLITKLVSQKGTAGHNRIPIATHDDLFKAAREMSAHEVTLTFTHPEGYLIKDIDVCMTSGEMHEPSNCYMVTDYDPVQLIPNEQISRAVAGIPGNSAAADAKLPANWFAQTPDKYKVAILWSDKPLTPKRNAVVRYVGFSWGKDGVNDSRLVVLPGNAEGNSVVILYEDKNGNDIYDGTDEIKWSWHIWNTPYNPDALAVVPVTNGPHSATGMNGSVYRYNATGGLRKTVFMDRNLGAADVALENNLIKITGTENVDNNNEKLNTYGLLYSWGKKDPYPMAKGFMTEKVTDVYYGFDKGHYEAQVISNTPNNFINTIKNPLLFYRIETPLPIIHSDWFTSTDSRDAQNDNLWDYQGNKTAYDPCPVGWRVPQSGLKDLSPWYNGYFAWEMGESYLSSSLFGNPESNNGFYFNDNAYNLGWWPATGAINYSTGELSPAGARTSYWAATSSTYINTPWAAFNFHINPSLKYLGPHNSATRVTGSPIRCVAE